MNVKDHEKNYLAFCALALFVVCLLIAYLLYWLIKKNKNSKTSKIRLRKKTIKSVRSIKRKKGEENRKSIRESEESSKDYYKLEKTKSSSDKKKVKQNEAYQRQKEHHHTSPEQASSSDASYTENLKPDSITSDYKKQQVTDVDNQYNGKQNKKDQEICNQQPGDSKMLNTFNESPVQSDIHSKMKKIAYIEPTKVLKEIMKEDIKENKDLKDTKDRTKSSSISLCKKTASSVIAYQTTPITNSLKSCVNESLNAGISSNITSKTEEINRNPVSILSITNSHVQSNISSVSESALQILDQSKIPSSRISKGQSSTSLAKEEQQATDKKQVQKGIAKIQRKNH